MSKRNLFDRILATLHEATLSDSAWPSTSALIDEACGAKGNGLAFGHTVKKEEDSRIMVAELTYRGKRAEALMREYFRDFYSIDERVPRVLQLSDGQVVHNSNLYTEEEKKHSLVYNDMLLRAQFQDGLLVRLDATKGSTIVWNIADPVGDNGWSSSQVGFVRRLLPHLRQYLCARQALADSGALGTSLSAMLDDTQIGILQLNWRGRVVAANDRAKAILREGDALRDERGMLSIRSADEDAVLQGILTRALPGYGQQGVGDSMQLAHPGSMQNLTLHVSPVNPREADFRSWAVAALVLVTENKNEVETSIDPNVLEEALGLTPTESQVAALLAQGKTVSEIAEAWDRSERTIRWHLMQIFDKLGVSRQAELVRRVLLLSDSKHMGKETL